MSIEKASPTLQLIRDFVRDKVEYDVNSKWRFARSQVRRLYDECTLPQQHRFNLLYDSPEMIRIEQIEWAILQLEDVVKKNKDTLSLKNMFQTKEKIYELQ